MKPFKINRNSWHYKLNKNFCNSEGYWMERSWEPKHNNFCAYWRATMFRTIFAGCFAFGVLGLLVMFGQAVWMYPAETATVIGTIVGIIAAIVGAVTAEFSIRKFFEKRAKAREETGAPQSLVVQKYKTYKSKVCPMVEYDS